MIYAENVQNVEEPWFTIFSQLLGWDPKMAVEPYSVSCEPFMENVLFIYLFTIHESIHLPQLYLGLEHRGRSNLPPHSHLLKLFWEDIVSPSVLGLSQSILPVGCA